jgi:hypothetical protein
MQCDALLPILITAGCATAIGKDVFQDKMSADVRRGILLLSPLGGNRYNWELGGQYHRADSFQMIVRSTSRNDAMALAVQATTALTFLTQLTIPALNTAPAMHLQYMRPVAEAIIYPKQPSGLWEASVNFDVTYATAPLH